MANGDQFLSGGGAMPVRLAPSNPAAVPVFESEGGGAMPVTVVTFEQNPGAMPVRLSTAMNGGAMPVRTVGTGFTPVEPTFLERLLAIAPSQIEFAYLAEDGFTPAQWSDLSGKGHHMLQSTEAKQPALAAINGADAVEFTGTDFMEATIAAGTFAQGLTWIVVSQKIGADNAFETLLTRTAGASAAPLDQYNAARFVYGTSATSSFNFKNLTSPQIFVQRIGVPRKSFEEWSNHSLFYDFGPGVPLVDQDTSTVVTMATRGDRVTQGTCKIGAALGFSGELTYEKISDFKDLLDGHFGIDLTPPADSVNIVFSGDSMTKSTVFGFTFIPAVLTAADAEYSGSVYFFNRGIDGQGFEYVWPGSGVAMDITDDAPFEVDAARIYGVDNWLNVLAGTNDIVLGGLTPAQTYARFETYLSARISAGWSADRIVVCTMLPREGMPYANVTAYAGLLAAGAVTHGYRIVRLDLNPDIGQDGDELDASKYPDGIHPSQSTCDIIAQEIIAVMFP